MTLIKIITIIVMGWLVLKVRRFISGIQITSGKSSQNHKKKSRSPEMDIQDGDYEDVD